MSVILSITALLCIMNEVWVVVFSNTEADEEQAFGRQLHALGGGFYMCTVIVTNNGIVCVCGCVLSSFKQKSTVWVGLIPSGRPHETKYSSQDKIIAVDNFYNFQCFSTCVIVWLFSKPSCVHILFGRLLHHVHGVCLCIYHSFDSRVGITFKMLLCCLIIITSLRFCGCNATEWRILRYIYATLLYHNYEIYA